MQYCMLGGNMDRRIIKSRRLMREALVSLMNEKSYDSITVKEITDRADLNRATFYLHFSDKDDLLFQANEDILYKVLDGIEQYNIEFFTGYTGIPDPKVLLFFKRIAENSNFFKVMLTKANIECTNRLQSFIYRWIYDNLSSISKNKGNPLIAIETISRYHSAALVGLLTWWLQNNMPYEAEEMVIQLSKLVNLVPKDTLYL